MTKYTVEVRSDESEDPGTPIYAQTVDAEAFDLAALIRAVNTRKRVRPSRAKKGE